jgi:hypothetical protein
VRDARAGIQSDPVTGDLASLGNAGYAHLTVERNRAS